MKLNIPPNVVLMGAAIAAFASFCFFLTGLSDVGRQAFTLSFVSVFAAGWIVGLLSARN